MSRINSFNERNVDTLFAPNQGPLWCNDQANSSHQTLPFFNGHFLKPLKTPQKWNKSQRFTHSAQQLCMLHPF